MFYIIISKVFLKLPDYIFLKRRQQMKKETIPLSMASLGEEYVIEYVESGMKGSSCLKGYGIMPGIKVRPLFRSPSKNPVAYEIMGAVLALRLEDSRRIYVTHLPHLAEKT